MKELNEIAQSIFGVMYNQLGLFGKWEVQDELKKRQDESNR